MWNPKQITAHVSWTNCKRTPMKIMLPRPVLGFYHGRLKWKDVNRWGMGILSRNPKYKLQILGLELTYSYKWGTKIFITIYRFVWYMTHSSFLCWLAVIKDKVNVTIYLRQPPYWRFITTYFIYLLFTVNYISLSYLYV